MYSPFEMKVYMNVMCVCGDGLVDDAAQLYQIIYEFEYFGFLEICRIFPQCLIYQRIECWMIIYLHDDLRIMNPVKWWPLNPGASKSLVLK